MTLIHRDTPRRGRRWRARTALAAGVLAMFVGTGGGAGLAAATARPVPSTNSGPLVFGASVPLSGFLAGTGTQVEDALNAYATYVNAHGGVGGRKLKWVYGDDGYPSATQAAVAAHTLVGEHVLGILNFGTPSVDATYSYLKSAGVPDFILFAGVSAFKPLAKSAYLVFSSYAQQGAALGQYVAQKFPGQAVTSLYQDDDLGSSYLSGFKRYDTHVNVAETYDPSDSDFSSQINAMRASGDKIATCFCLSGQLAQLLQIGQQTGWDPTVVTESANAGASLVSQVGASLAEGVISMSFFPNTTGPGASKSTASLISDMQSENSSVPVDSFTEVSAALSELLVSALSPIKGTITRGAVVQALAAVHSKGAWYGTTNTSGEPEQPALFSCWTMDVIHNGVTVPKSTVTCGDQLQH